MQKPVGGWEGMGSFWWKFESRKMQIEVILKVATRLVCNTVGFFSILVMLGKYVCVCYCVGFGK